MLSDDLLHLSRWVDKRARSGPPLTRADLHRLASRLLECCDRASIAERRPVPTEARGPATGENVVRLCDHRRREC